MRNFIKFILKNPIKSFVIITFGIGFIIVYLIDNNLSKSEEIICYIFIPIITSMASFLLFSIVGLICDSEIVFDFLDGDYKNLLD